MQSVVQSAAERARLGAASGGCWAACLVLAWACQAEGPGRRASAEPGLQANLAAATAPSPAQAPVGPLERPSEPLSVILITVEALRADMPWSGYSRAIAPHLTEFG